MKSAIDNVAPFINGDGEQTRDFTYVANAVQANVKSLLSNVNGHEVINIAFGERTSLNELWVYIKELTSASVNPKYRDVRQGDVKDSLADISKARKLIGYDPGYSVKDGLALALNWYKENE
jgi:UDP-N-acetylglucosamine 4-epimerase